MVAPFYLERYEKVHAVPCQRAIARYASGQGLAIGGEAAAFAVPPGS